MKIFSKKCAIPVFVLFFTVLITAGCKEEEPEPQKNSFSYNSKEAVIGFALADIYGSTSQGVFGVTFYFLENTLQWPFEIGAPGAVARSGDILSFTLLVNDPANIPSGTYPFNKNDGTLVNTLFGGDSQLLVNFNTSNGSSSNEIEIIGGKIVVLKTVDEYEITIDCSTDYNTRITGYYKGKIENEDISGKSKTDFSTTESTLRNIFK